MKAVKNYKKKLEHEEITASKRNVCKTQQMAILIFESELEVIESFWNYVIQEKLLKNVLVLVSERFLI